MERTAEEIESVAREYVLHSRRREYQRALRSGMATIKYQDGKHVRYWEVWATTEEQPRMKETFEAMRICNGGKYISHTFRTWAEIDGLTNPDEESTCQKSAKRISNSKL